MAASKIFFENCTAQTIHLFLRTHQGLLEMHFFDQAQPASTAIPSQRRIGVDITPSIQTCMNENRLNFMLVSHHKGGLDISCGRERLAEGPIFVLRDPVS